jgi:uncharacterized protein (TIGR02246 family)
MTTRLHSRHRQALIAIAVVASMVCAVTGTHADDSADATKIRAIIDDEITAWNRGDADGYSKHFSADGTFTNIRGLFFVGYQEFRDRHELVFKGEFRGTTLEQRIVSMRFIRPDVASVETLASVSGFKAGIPPGSSVDEKRRLNARLLQVLKKDGGSWKIVVYHNVDVKPGTPVPELD